MKGDHISLKNTKEETMNTQNKAPRPGELSVYGDHLTSMYEVMDEIMQQISDVREEMKRKRGEDPIDHCLARIKSDASMRAKLKERNLPETPESALFQVKDAIGIRIVCGFLSDLYAIRDHIADFRDAEIVHEKDYIRHAKPNGYRSYHLILKVKNTYYVEIQLRTISMDTWAALEHQLRYKKNATENDALIASELKRCADELASTDVSMQTIRDMILGEGDLWS